MRPFKGLKEGLRHADRQREADERLDDAFARLEMVTKQTLRLALRQQMEAEAVESGEVDLREIKRDGGESSLGGPGLVDEPGGGESPLGESDA